MAGGRKRVAGSGPSQSPDLTRVDRPDQDDDEVASSYAGRVQGPTESRPTSKTAWDFAEAMGAPEHASRVLRDLDPVEVIAIAAYAYARTGYHRGLDAPIADASNFLPIGRHRVQR